AISPDEVSTYLKMLIQLPGASVWRKREQTFAQQIRANPLIEEYLNSRFALERAMGSVVRYRENTGRFPKATSDDIGDAVRRLYSFVGMIGRVYPLLSKAGQRNLAGRVRGALADKIGLMPLAFEMQTACHFMTHGFDVEFHDLERGGGQDFV